MEIYSIKIGQETVFETENEEQAKIHCECLNEAYRTNMYYVEIEFE